MSDILRNVPRKLHSALGMATDLLDLPLSDQQREALALELTGPVRALIAEALAEAGEETPVQYAVAEGPVQDGEFEITQAEGCTARVGLDVDLDSPAAVLAQKLRTSQCDVVSTEVPDDTTLGITVRPESLDYWLGWLGRFGIDPKDVKVDGDSMTAIGRHRDVTVQLRVEGVSELLADHGAAWLMGLVPEPSPARP